MKRLWWGLACVWLVASCRFELDRALGRGEVRATLGVRGDQGFVPVAKAKLRLVGTRLEARSDDEGAVVIRGVPPGTFDVRASEGEGASERGLLLRGMTFGGRDESEGVDLGKLTLEAVGAIEGTVKLAGAGLAGALVATPGVPPAKTDTNGGFRIARLAPGAYTLWVERATGDGRHLGGPVSVTVAAAKATTVTLDLDTLATATPGTVHGSARQADNGDYANIEISLTPAGGGEARAVFTDADGLFTVDVPAGIYTVRARRSGAADVVIPGLVVSGDVPIGLLVLGDPAATDDLDDDGLPDATQVVAALRVTAPARIARFETFDVTIEAISAAGTVVPSFTGTIQITSDSAAITIPATVEFTAVERGVATVTATAEEEGSALIRVSDGHAISGATPAFEVVPPLAKTLSIEIPAGVRPNTAFDVTVRAHDAEGALVPGYRGDVQLTIDDPAGVVSPGRHTFTAADGGTFVFQVTVPSTRAMQLTATDGSLVMSAPVTATDGPPYTLEIEVPATAANVEADSLVNVTARVLGPTGSAFETFVGTFDWTVTDPDCVLPPPLTFSSEDHGRRTVTLVLRRPGSTRIALHDTVAQASVNVTVRLAPLVLTSLATTPVGDGALEVSVRAAQPARRKFDVSATWTAGTVTKAATLRTTPGAGLRQIVAGTEAQPALLRYLWDAAADGVSDGSVALTLHTRDEGGAEASILTTFTYARRKPRTVASVNTSTSAPTGVVGDLDRDGRPEAIALSSSGYETFAVDAQGALSSATTFTLAQDTVGAAIGNVVGSAAPDLVLTTRSPVGVLVLIGDDTKRPTTTTFVTTSGVTNLSRPVIGDFNRDGVADVAVVDQGLGQILVFPGSRTGALGSTPVRRSIGGSPSAIVLADVDRNGWLDAVCVNRSNGLVRIEYAGAAGFFSGASFTGPAAQDLALADFDGDGFLDLVLAPVSGTDVIYLRGSGSASFPFQDEKAIPAGVTSGRLHVAHWDRDGKPDLVITSAGAAPVVITDVALGTSAHPFTVGTEVGIGGVADLDADGLDDAVLFAGSALKSLVSADRVRAATALDADPVALFDAAPTLVAAADLDRNGLPDLVVATDTTSQLQVALNAGNGVYAARPVVPLTVAPASLLLADGNGDGFTDAFLTAAGSSRFTLVKGDGTGLLGNAASTNAIDLIDEFAVADLTRDGINDVVTLTRASGRTRIWAGSTGGSFAQDVLLSAPAGARGLLAGDFDGNGTREVALLDPAVSKVTIYARTDPTRAQRAFTLSNVPVAFAEGALDVNGDGAEDLAVITDKPSIQVFSGLDGTTLADVEPPTGPAVTWAHAALVRESFGGTAAIVVTPTGAGPATRIDLEPGDVTLTQRIVMPAAAPAFADFDGDGALDVAVSDGVSVRIARGAGLPPTFAPELGQALYLTAGDWDRNGKVDVVGGLIVPSTTAVLVPGQGDATFQAARTLLGPSDNTFRSIGSISDLDQDGAPDLVFGLGSVRGLSLGWGALGAGLAAGVDAINGDRADYFGGISSVTAGDFNGDGLRDLALVQSDTWLFGALLAGATRGSWTPTPLIPVGGQSWQHAVADFDGDGLDDVVTCDASEGLRLHTSLGDGTFTTHADVAAPGFLVAPARDFDHDGQPDVVTEGGGKLTITRYSSGILVPGAQVDVPESCTHLASGDTDGDGLVEAVLLCGGVVVRVPMGLDGTWGTPRAFSAGGSGMALAVGDFDGSGTDDVVVSIYAEGARVLRAP